MIKWLLDFPTCAPTNSKTWYDSYDLSHITAWVFGQTVDSNYLLKVRHRSHLSFLDFRGGYGDLLVCGLQLFIPSVDNVGMEQSSMWVSFVLVDRICFELLLMNNSHCKKKKKKSCHPPYQACAVFSVSITGSGLESIPVEKPVLCSPLL